MATAKNVLYTGGNRVPWSQNLLVVNPSEPDREKETDFFGVLLFMAVFGLRSPKWTCKALILRDYKENCFGVARHIICFSSFSF